jgi:hypothetical protein
MTSPESTTFELAEATYRPAIARWPAPRIMLRQGARVVHDTGVASPLKARRSAQTNSPRVVLLNCPRALRPPWLDLVAVLAEMAVATLARGGRGQSRLPEPRPIRYPATRSWLARDRMHFDQLKRRDFITLLGGGSKEGGFNHVNLPVQRNAST